ncbi:MAG: ribonuclease D [Chloroflexi bacterium]|nr:ribonuclease D [Chloroflexota bacterium]
MTPAAPDLKPAIYIRHNADLQRLVGRLRGEPLLAVDTESNNLFAYYERVCLVQLSTRQHDYIIDPLAVSNMAPLGELFADPRIEIVFHAAEYDIMTLKRDFHYEFNNLFDTMLAARICGWNAVGLGNILAEQFGVRAEKKYQRADWTARPLPPEQLLYAQMDTHYLPELRDRLLAELQETGHLEEAREIFAGLPALPPAEYVFDPEAYWRIHEARSLRRSQMGLLRALYLLRDDEARRRDVPPFKVFNDSVLVEIARLSPRRVEDLHGIRGFSQDQVRRYGPKIVQALAEARREPPPQPPRRTMSANFDVQARYEALREWRKQRALARGVESDVILSRDTMWTLARKSPTTLEDLEQIPGLGPWRRAEYGSELLEVLKQASRNHDR